MITLRSISFDRDLEPMREDYYPIESRNTFRPSGQYNIIEPEDDKEYQEICLNCGHDKGSHLYKDHRYYC